MNGVTAPFDKLRANGDKLTGQYWGGIFRRICLINYGLLSNISLRLVTEIWSLVIIWKLGFGDWNLIQTH